MISDVNIEMRFRVGWNYIATEVLVKLVWLSAEQDHSLTSIFAHLFPHERLQVHVNILSNSFNNHRSSELYCNFNSLLEIGVVLPCGLKSSKVVILLFKPGYSLELRINHQNKSLRFVYYQRIIYWHLVRWKRVYMPLSDFVAVSK